MIQHAGRSSQEQLVGLQTLIEQLLDQEQVESLVDCALQFLRAELDYPLLWIAMYDADQSELSGLGGGVPYAESSAFGQRYPVLPGDLFDQVLLTRQPIEVMNLQEESRVGKWQKIAQRYQIQGAVLYPLQYRQDALGVLLLGSAHWGRNPRVEENSQLSILTKSLGAAFHHLNQEAIPPDPSPAQPLNAILNQISSLTDWEDRLNVVLQSTQQMIGATFTGLYWFDLEENSCRLKSCYQPGQGNRLGRVRPIRAEVQLTEIEAFCQALSLGQIVSVSESQGMVNTKAPLRLMQQTKSRSLLCAPVMGDGQLLGFLSAEGIEPRVWQEQEKQFIQAAAQLVSLAVVSPVGERPVQVSSQTHTLMGQFTQLMLESNDWPKTLKQLTEHLCRHLQTQRLMLLQQDEGTGEFRVEYQYHSPKLRPLLGALHPLSDVDQRMLERNIGAIALSDLEEDLRFLAWRESLMSQGVRSLVVCRTTASSKSSHTILVLGSHRTRTWQPNELELLQQFAQTLGTFEQKQRDYLLQQHQLKLYSLAQKGLQTLLEIDDPTQLMATGVELITDIFNAPLVAGVLWVPGQDQGRIVAYQAAPPEFSITDSSPIPIRQDPLLKQLFTSTEDPSQPPKTLIKAAARSLAPETRLWLNSPGLDKVIVLAVQSPDAPTPLGAMILGTATDDVYKTFDLRLIQTLVQALASRYRALRETHLLHRKWINLECLNWYKQRSLEFESKQLQTALQKIYALALAPSTQQHLDPLKQRVDDLNSLLITEGWQLNLDADTTPLASILRRSMERIEPIIEARQLWTQVHNLTTNTTLTGTSQKLELVLYELLLAACQRSKLGDRIDIWCRLINAKWVELSITDQGQLHPQFIQDFQSVKSRDLLAPSLLDKTPGRYLRVCHALIEHLGGRIELAHLEDGRILSRLTLPLQTSSGPKR
ncbi:GAF domain-containing protein [Acaryochloris sp. IP29b_bin.148]|uniref:GAF domain-containing protein n=1 Tax=Acaryochloris sp. IP29b_bin.148 TaxID=2969218 RepID=UPI002604F5CC|nr:GAF domain-containing protein [Acaryochloris sp. IP29b_bin.148]